MERKLETIQQKEKLNEVYAVDEIGPGGANHKYEIKTLTDGTVVGIVQLQCGPRKLEDSIQGVIDTDLLEIVRDRMVAFQKGPFASAYNEETLKYVELALQSANKRIEDRIARNVLGTNTK